MPHLQTKWHETSDYCTKQTLNKWPIVFMSSLNTTSPVQTIQTIVIYNKQICPCFSLFIIRLNTKYN